MDADDARAARFKQAVFARDGATLRELFSAHTELSEVIDEPWFHFGKPAIVQAAGYRDRELVDTLIDLGADIEARSAWEAGPYSALHALVDGATEESLALADHVAARGADVDIHAAAGMGRAERIEECRDRQALRRPQEHPGDVGHGPTGGRRALPGRERRPPGSHMAVVLDDVALAEEILQCEPSAIDVRVRFGGSHEHLGFGDKYVWALGGPDTPVELARVRGKPATYAFLLERSSPAVCLVQASRREDVETMSATLAADPELLTPDQGPPRVRSAVRKRGRRAGHGRARSRPQSA